MLCVMRATLQSGAAQPFQAGATLSISIIIAIQTA